MADAGAESTSDPPDPGGPAAHWVLHVDMDQFIAAVEILRRPELAGKAVIVGGRGDPTERGVVSTASYEAREHGVGSGMPLRVAARRCPEAVFLPVDAPTYLAASEQVMDELRALGMPVEVLGWDEAFVGAETIDPVGLAREIQRRILQRTRLHCSVGIGDNKLRAKIATGFGKPSGTYVLTRQNWYEVMGGRPTEALWGLGRKTAARLAELGISTVLDLARADEHFLAEHLGPTLGPMYRRMGRGGASAVVEPGGREARSHSRETTFQVDLTDWAVVRDEVRRLAAQVTQDVRAAGRPAVRVAVKVRYAPFDTRTRSVTLAAPTSEVDAITEAALGLLVGLADGRAVRLLGVRAEFAADTGADRPPAGV